MNDQQAWSLGIDRVSALLEDLPEEVRRRLTALLAHYRQIKETLAAVVSEYDPASACRDCRGQCCLNGKYRMNVFDALALRAAQLPLLADFVQKPVCPYGTDRGCTMESGIRPADCVLFICDLLDQKLSPRARLMLAEQEQILRRCIFTASELTGEPLGKPLLLWAETVRSRYSNDIKVYN